MNKKKLYSSLLLLAILLISLYGKNLAPSDTAGSGTQPTATVTETTTDSKASPTEQSDESTATVATQTTYTFRNADFLQEHFDKHGDEFDYATAEEYQAGASRVVNGGNALHKLEKEDGDGIYYLESTNELVIVSTDGYIRTYFKPDGGKKYFEKQ